MDFVLALQHMQVELDEYIATEFDSKPVAQASRGRGRRRTLLRDATPVPRDHAMALQPEVAYVGGERPTVSNDGKVVTIHVSGRFDFMMHQDFCAHKEHHAARPSCVCVVDLKNAEHGRHIRCQRTDYGVTIITMQLSTAMTQAREILVQPTSTSCSNRLSRQYAAVVTLDAARWPARRVRPAT